MELEEIDMEEVNAMVGVTGGGGGAFNAKDSSPSTPEDDAEPTKKPRKKEKGDAGAKKAAEEKQQSAAASLRRRSASFEELQAVDWNAVTKSTPVKYDPNRLIFGATEDGFMELEEIDMEEVNAMAIGGAAAASGGQRDVHAELTPRLGQNRTRRQPRASSLAPVPSRPRRRCRASPAS